MALFGTRAMRLGLLFALLVALALFPSPAVKAADADIVGSATVLTDGSLRVNSSRVRLYGIYIPPSGQKCATFISPARCGTRAALALDNRIHGFVFCHSIHGNSDGSVSAVCFHRRTFYDAGEDLALFLVSRGLALALPGAPFEYVAFERVAQTRQLGIWGFSVDAISPSRRWWDGHRGGRW
jgi:endonuclease YncB( thermonuclease family)